MNKIFLDKLCEFTHTTYKNYNQLNSKEKDINVDDQIEIIKQNFSLNEKGINQKFNYIDLSTLIPNVEFDQLVLLHPIAYNIKEDYEWNYLLNALLIVLNDDYMYKSSVIKKKTIETFDKTFRKKMVIEDKLDNKILEKISKLVNITLIILTTKEKFIFGDKKNLDKVVILFKINREYYPIMNWTQKYFNGTDLFVKYILENIFKNMEESEDTILIEKKGKTTKSNKIKESEKIDEPIKMKKIKSNITIDEEKNTINTISKNKIQEETQDLSSDYKKNNEFYAEVLTEANGALFMSEAVDNKESIVSSTSKNNDTKKKTKKNSKDIFVPTNDKKLNQEEKDINKSKKESEDSVFKKTEKLNKKEIDEIKNSIDKNLTLGELQEFAIKLSINIAKVSEKTGKPKAKTKQELIDKIKEVIKSLKA